MTCVYMYISLEYLSIMGCFSMDDDDDDGCGWLCYKKQRRAVDSYYGNGNTKECVWCVSLNLFGTLRHIPNNIAHTHQPRDAGTRKKKWDRFRIARYSLIAPRMMIRKEKETNRGSASKCMVDRNVIFRRTLSRAA